jgi:hypothetical protein
MLRKLTLTAILALLAAAPAPAQDYRERPREPDRGRSYDRDRRDRRDRRPVRDERNVWRYFDDGGGTFEHTRGDQWVQYRRSGGPLTYREVARRPDYVEIYDENRDLPVRLYNDRLYQDNGDGFTPMFEGRWE